MMDIVFWGTGIRCKRLLQELNNEWVKNIRVTGFIETVPRSSNFNELNVYSPEDFISQDIKADYIFVTPVNSEQIFDYAEKKYPELFCIMRTYSDFYAYVVYLNKDYFNSLNIIFFGNRKSYDVVSVRACTIFHSFVYTNSVKKINQFYKDFDAIILLTSDIISTDSIKKYETWMRHYLATNSHFTDGKIYGRDQWWKYVMTDRIIIKKNGLNPDKTFFVIGVEDRIRGWGNLLENTTKSIMYAKRRNMIPVIDMQNFPNQYLENSKFGIHNSWNDYFKPINYISLDEVYKSKNLIICGVDVDRPKVYDITNIRYNSCTRRYINREKAKIMPSNSRVAGVIYRGTDYNLGDDSSHPVINEIDSYMNLVEKNMKESDCKYLFLATEIEEIVKVFQKKFKGRVIYTDQRRYHESERRFLSDVHFNRKNDRYVKGLEYLAVLDILSDCNIIIGPECGTLRGAVILNDGRYDRIVNVSLSSC